MKGNERKSLFISFHFLFKSSLFNGNYILDSLLILCAFLVRSQGVARCPRARFPPSSFSRCSRTRRRRASILKARLWPNGPRCPVCGLGERITARKDGFYRCNQCKEDFTVRTGTIFERSHVPLHKWIYAMYLLVTARKGISSMQLAKEIGITQKSAWFVLHRLREACGSKLEKLQGIVEIDETYRRRQREEQARVQEAQGRTRHSRQDAGSRDARAWRTHRCHADRERGQGDDPSRHRTACRNRFDAAHRRKRRVFGHSLLGI